MRSASPVVRAVGRALPKHYASQEALIAAFRKHWEGRHFNLQRLEELQRAVQVSGRYLALPLEEYEGLDSFRKCNDAWTRLAVDVGAQALQQGLDAAGLRPRDVDHLFFTTVTGIATPSIDARLVNRLGLRPDVKRTPMFGLGCAAGAAGAARASDSVRAYPGQVAVLVSVELCSLTLQRDDVSIPNIIASGLFGDGAAALVLEGAERGGGPGPRVIATRSVLVPDTERILGWDIVDTGFKIVLSARLPALVRDHAAQDVDSFLAEHGLDRSRVRHWMVHAAGPKVLTAFQEALSLPDAALERSWRSLREVGNLSSASVLFVLGELLDSGEAREGDFGLLVGMGPGFTSELVLLRW